MSEDHARPEPGPTLASQIAHELKNPLMGIKGLAATGNRLYDSLSDGERRELFQLIDEESDRLDRLVERAYLLLELEAGNITYVIMAGPLEPIAQEAAEGHDRVKLEVQAGVSALYDPVWTKAVFAELIENAERFSPSDSPIEVRVGADGDGRVGVEVTSEGPGLWPEDLERAFDPFTTVRPSGYEDVRGAGIGLYLARAHVTAQGGTMRMETRPDRGTILAFTLPGEGDR
ncbi:MAG: ATP-binding protein [Actinomycetota bacterium]